MQVSLFSLVPHMKYSRGLFHLPSSLQWICSIVNLRFTFVLTQPLLMLVGPHSVPVLAAAEVREEAEPAKEGN